MNDVYRQCDKCKFEAHENEFSYMGDGVWHCPRCQSMWTTITRIEPQEQTP